VDVNRMSGCYITLNGQATSIRKHASFECLVFGRGGSTPPTKATYSKTPNDNAFGFFWL
jgi:hypothetical protein